MESRVLHVERNRLNIPHLLVPGLGSSGCKPVGFVCHLPLVMFMVLALPGHVSGEPQDLSSKWWNAVHVVAPGAVGPWRCLIVCV